MTGPNTFQYPSYYPSGDSEWSAFLQRRNQLLTDIENRVKLSQFLTEQDPTLALKPGLAQAAADSVANTHEVQGQNQNGSLTKFQWSRSEPTNEEVNQLLGAAKFWNIDNAEKIPPKALRNIIEAKRLSAAAEGRGGLNPLADVGLTSLAAIGLGTTQTLIGLAQKIPFIGHAVAENQYTKQASQWLASLNEGVQAGMSEGERTGYSIAHGLGGMLGSAPAFGAAWKAAGAVGGLGAVASGATKASVIARGGAAAAQGGLSAWLISGGGDQSNAEAATNIALGAGLGVAGVALMEGLPRLAARLKTAFPTSQDIPLDRRNTAFRDNTVDAEWYFEADRQLQNSTNRPRGWLPEGTPDAPAGPDPFFAERPSTETGQPGTSLVTQPAGSLMSPERAAITERILSLEEHRDLARRAMETDALTGLGNKRALARVQDEVDMDQSLGWAVFDGKKFKLVNDTHGHNVGDQTLINFGRAITQAAQEMNIPARIFRQGGDEFSAVVPKDQLQDFTQRVAQLSYQKVGGVETWLDGYAHNTFGEADLTLMSNKRGGTASPKTTLPTFDRQNFERFAIESGASRVGATGEFPTVVPGAGDYAATGLVPLGGDANLLHQGFYPHSDLVANPNRFAPSYRETNPDLITQGNKPAEATATGVTVHTPPQVARPDPNTVLPAVVEDSHVTAAEDYYMDMARQFGTNSPEALAASKRIDNLVGLRVSRGSLKTIGDELRFLPQVTNVPDGARWMGHGIPGETPITWWRREGDKVIQTDEYGDETGAEFDINSFEAQDAYVERLSARNTRDDVSDFGSIEVVADDAAALTKQAIVLNSEELPAVAASSEIDVADVVKAQMSTAPGEVHIIQRVGDLGKTLRQLTQAQVNQKLMPHNFRIVERSGGFDLLVADGRAISNKQVEQYRQFGFFDGQAAHANGTYGIIKTADAGDNTAIVHSIYLDQDFRVPHEQIMPSLNSLTIKVEDGPILYNDFRDYVEEYMAREAAKVPDANIKVDWLSPETSSQLPRLLDAFLEDRFVDQPLARAAYESYFNIQRVKDFQMSAPEEFTHLQDLTTELAAVRDVNPIPYLPIEDIANTKGFRYMAEPGTRGGTLVDQLSDLRVPVENEDAAYEFLRNFNRDVPDYTPISDVPIEIMGDNPYAGNPGDDLQPIHEDQHHAMRESADRIAARIEREIEAMIRTIESGAAVDLALPQTPGGSGFGGGRGGPPLGTGLEEGGSNALPPGRRPSLGEQFAELHRTNPRAYYEVAQSLDGFLTRWFTPWRHVTAMIEHELKEVGLSEAKLWAHQNAVSIGVTEAHNAALPWQVEWADIMSQFRRPMLRKGVVTKIAELTDPFEQQRAMKEAGYTDREIVAQHRIKDFNDRFFRMLVDDPTYNIDDSRYIAGYMSHVRMRQGQPGIEDPYAGGEAMLPPHLRFFAEMVREGNMQFRQMDPRVLGTKMIRSAFFKKFVDPPYHEMRQAWNDPRIPTKFRELATDWLEVVRTGHQPGHDEVTSGVTHMLNKVGIPLTQGEVTGLMNVGIGNMYRAQLGGRPDAIFRDFIQIWFTGVRIGFSPVNGALLDFVRSPKINQEMQQRALAGGWLEKGMTQVANADIWEAGVQTPEGISLLSESQTRRREIMASIGDIYWSALPRNLRAGLQGTLLDPLRYYTKLGEMLRVVTGEAGYRLARTALNEYQSTIETLAESTDPALRLKGMDEAMKKLMKASKAQAYHRVVQDQFRSLVENGQDEQAAYLLANKAADHQFRYGSKEAPIGIRKAGMAGRLGMQFGSFTTQYVGEMRDMFTSPGVPVSEKVQMGLRYGAVTAALGLAASYTGWRFNRWHWHQSLTFAGGPAWGAIINAGQAISGYAAESFGVTPSPMQSNAMRSWNNPGGMVLGGIAKNIDPYASTRRTIGGIVDMAGSQNPVEGTARAIVTGEASLQPDIRQFFEKLGEQTIWPQTAGVGTLPGFPAPASNIRPYNPADSSVPGITRMSEKGYPVYNSLNVGPDGRVPTHRLDVPSGKGPNETWEQYEARVINRPLASFPREAFRSTNEMAQLDPEMRGPLQGMLAAAQAEGIQLRVNETYRPTERQELLFKQGRDGTGSVVTWTLTSDHTTRRAADLQPVGGDVERGWQWIQENGPRFGFKVLGSKDPGHVSLPLAPMAQQAGMLGAGGGAQ